MCGRWIAANAIGIILGTAKKKKKKAVFNYVFSDIMSENKQTVALHSVSMATVERQARRCVMTSQTRSVIKGLALAESVVE